GHDMLVLQAMVRDGAIPLLGPQTSIGTFHHGAAYYYLLAPAAFVSGADPVAVTGELALFGIAAVAATWWLARLVGGPVAGLGGAPRGVAGGNRGVDVHLEPEPHPVRVRARLRRRAARAPVQPRPLVGAVGPRRDARHAMPRAGDRGGAAARAGVGARPPTP